LPIAGYDISTGGYKALVPVIGITLLLIIGGGKGVKVTVTAEAGGTNIVPAIRTESQQSKQQSGNKVSKKQTI